MRTMNRTVRIFQVDAFTTQPFAGNPAGVILDAEQLSDAQMQALARELNNGDSAFVLPPDGTDHDLRVRFFTPRAEAAFVGHATVAVHRVLAALGLPPRRRQRQKSGLVEVDLLGDPAAPRIAIRQPAPQLKRHISDAELAAVLAALKLTPTSLDSRFPAMIAGESSTRLLLGLRDAATLGALEPDLAQLAALSSTLHAAGYFLFTTRPQIAACDTEARMFCPAIGIAEDPVSGNAHGMLGAYLLKYGALTPQDNRAEFIGAQGHHVGRPGRVTISLELDGAALKSVRIIGDAVIVFQASVTLGDLP